ncbi:DNA cytosine methyltransferase [Acinetobacter baumannii]|uniref:DNA cytosine methyltransferase n=1 Tax=Acinetobacter baumannii TaxID=470 RepID=UPI001BB46DE9|nr:DNA cytosine methyltransferase [Acinetobacter baumannii]MCT9166706.1 DNA cytosine methyltransferase [Acinetobacter baumannii]MCT9173940.1 DNA cytosine methyltransferase [Acinetobacter baumannii]MCT9179645.1 DNA cytosine methyltransferase [Acinetobacter baumannii]
MSVLARDQDLFSSYCSDEEVFQLSEDLFFDMYQEEGWPDKFGELLEGWFKTQNTRKIPTLSLFSGGGGLDIGFKNCNFEILEQVEIDTRYVETLEQNTNENTLVHCIDIRNYIPSPNLKVEMIIGGPPCQSFSAAGRRIAGVNGTTDPRGTLFEEYVRLLKTLEPKAFLFENVTGILSAQKGKAWHDIKVAFEEAGYQIFFKVLDSADYGVPQHRERVFIVGLKSGIFLFPRPTHGPDAGKPYNTAGKSLKNINIEENLDQLKINGKWGHLIKDIPPGLNYSFYTAEMGYPKPVFAWRSKFSDFMYKADPNSPVRTLKANGGQYTGPLSWENRHFSIDELKRLQTIPDNYILSGTRAAKIQQIGNSVPPQMARILALSVLEQVFNKKIPLNLSYLMENEKPNFKSRKKNVREIYLQKAKNAIASINLEDLNYLQNDLFYNQITISSDFNLTEGYHNNGIQADITYEVINNILIIKGEFRESNSNEFSIVLKPNLRKGGWIVPFQEIKLIGKTNDIFNITTLWKVLENYLLKEFGIADFVQLSGYYQYEPKVLATLISNENDDYWKALRLIINYIGVGKQISIDELSDLWNIDKNSIHKILLKLREIGYEIRNHNTNSQIPVGQYLIPYFFPSLTPPSLQRYKSL